MRIHTYIAMATFAIVTSAFVFSPALAMKSLQTAELDTPGTSKTLQLPAEAASAKVISLGSAVDPQSGKVVEGYAFVHHRHNEAKPPWAGGGKDKGGSTCYAVQAKDAKWRTTESYVVDPTNAAGLSATDVSTILANSLETWDSEVAFDIFGNEMNGVVDGADETSPDGKNEVLFGSISEPGVIAVTITWGIFNGPPSQRELVEWDQVYNDVDFTWSTNGSASDMDFENIVTHELGHALGLGHPDSTCTEETMYAYAENGEIKKRDLADGDIQGLYKLYQ